jgi:hypothetical protein
VDEEDNLRWDSDIFGEEANDVGVGDEGGFRGSGNGKEGAWTGPLGRLRTPDRI